MKRLAIPTLIAALSAPSAHAQFVPGNDAIRIDALGRRHIDTPPIPAGVLAAPCPATRDGCSGGGWHMVETVQGLMECTELYARAGTCRPSRYGIEKRARVWIVKRHGQWLQCQYPSLASTCVGTSALAHDAVQ